MKNKYNFKVKDLGALPILYDAEHLTDGSAVVVKKDYAHLPIRVANKIGLKEFPAVCPRTISAFLAEDNTKKDFVFKLSDMKTEQQNLKCGKREFTRDVYTLDTYEHKDGYKIVVSLNAVFVDNFLNISKDIYFKVDKLAQLQCVRVFLEDERIGGIMPLMRR